MTTNLPAKKKFLIVIALILVLGTALTVMAANRYYNQSKVQLAAAKEAFNAGDWRASWLHADHLTGWYALSPVSNSDEVKTLKDQSSLLAFGADSREQGDYANALQAYSTYLVLYPEHARKHRVGTIPGELYFEWGQQLRENNQPELAYQKYQILLKEYPDTPSADAAAKAIPAALLEWAITLKEDQQTTQAQELLMKVVMDYPNSDAAPLARSQMARTYALAGQQHLEENALLPAMQAYSEAMLFATDQETKSAIEEGYQTALLALSNDTGADGQQIVAQTVELACKGERAASPVVGISKDLPARGLLCQSSIFNFPPEWQATAPGNLEYVVRIDSVYRDGQTCYYSSDGRLNPGMFTHSLTVRNEEVSVRVISAESGGMVDFMTFSSASNYSCPSSRMFSSMSEYIDGGMVSEDVILNWLKTYFE